MFKKLYLLPLLSSVYFAQVPALIAMESDQEDVQSIKRPLTLLPMEGESLEATIGEIDHYLETSIAYSQKKLNVIKDIYSLYSNPKTRRQARQKFNNLMGEGAAPREDRDFFKELQHIKYVNEMAIIYNGTSLRRDLYDNLNGEYKYPRNAVGAALISAAATLEIKDNEKAKNSLSLQFKNTDIADYLTKIHTDEILFYTYIQQLLHPYWIESHIENERAFGQEVREQNDTYKAKKEAIKQKAEEEERSKKQAAKQQKQQKQQKVSGRGRGRDTQTRSHVQQMCKTLPQQLDEMSKLSLQASEQEATIGVTVNAQNTLEVVEAPQPVVTTTTSITSSADTTAPVQITPVAITLTIASTSPSGTKTLKKQNTATTTTTTTTTTTPTAILTPPVSPQIAVIFDTNGINSKYRTLFRDIFIREETREKIAWNDVKNMMENAFKGKMYGAKGGSQRQFAVFLREKEGELTTFVTIDDYNQYIKSCKRTPLDYKILRKVVHTEKPHSRGQQKKGQTRHMYPTLIELFASSLEKVGLTPQNLGW